jgi:predicted nucleic acid-binding protein
MIGLDTNAIVPVLDDRSSPVRTRIDAAVRLGYPLAILSIVLFPLRYGAAKSTRPGRNTQRIADLLSEPLEFLRNPPVGRICTGRPGKKGDSV